MPASPIASPKTLGETLLQFDQEIGDKRPLLQPPFSPNLNAPQPDLERPGILVVAKTTLLTKFIADLVKIALGEHADKFDFTKWKRAKGNDLYQSYVQEPLSGRSDNTVLALLETAGRNYLEPIDEKIPQIIPPFAARVFMGSISDKAFKKRGPESSHPRLAHTLDSQYQPEMFINMSGHLDNIRNFLQKLPLETPDQPENQTNPENPSPSQISLKDIASSFWELHRIVPDLTSGLDLEEIANTPEYPSLNNHPLVQAVQKAYNTELAHAASLIQEGGPLLTAIREAIHNRSTILGHSTV